MDSTRTPTEQDLLGHQPQPVEAQSFVTMMGLLLLAGVGAWVVQWLLIVGCRTVATWLLSG